MTDLTPDIDSEILAWIAVAEEQMRKDKLMEMETGRYYGVSIVPPSPPVEADRINRQNRINLLACERAEVLCRIFVTEFDEQLSADKLSGYQMEYRLTST